MQNGLPRTYSPLNDLCPTSMSSLYWTITTKHIPKQSEASDLPNMWSLSQLICPHGHYVNYSSIAVPRNILASFYIVCGCRRVVHSAVILLSRQQYRKLIQ